MSLTALHIEEHSAAATHPARITHIPVSDLLVYSYGGHEAILMLRAYWDESGHSASSRFVCIGGALASALAWSRFEQEWSDTLTRYGISEFHMTEFEASTYEFEKWRDNREEHQAFLAELLGIMDRHIDRYIGTVENVWEHQLLSGHNPDPYFNCLLSCLDGAASYVATLGGAEKVQMVFAQNAEYTRAARDLYPRVQAVKGMYECLGPDTYGMPKDVLPLQAADLVAFEIRKEKERQLGGFKRPERWPLTRLKRKPFHWNGYWL